MSRNFYYIALAIALVGLIAISSVESQRIAGDDRMDPNTALNLSSDMQVTSPPPVPLSSCNVFRDNCGSISPNPSSIFIADGAHNSLEETIFFVDVPIGGNGIFQIDPSTCSIVSGTYYSLNGGSSQRGIGYDASRHEIWVGGWIDYYINQHDANPPYIQISSNYLGLATASIAVDTANQYLFISTSSYPDYLYVYDISGGGLGSLLGAWSIPWQTSSDGYDIAGMGFDDDSGDLIMVNQNAAGPGETKEQFSFSLTGGPVADGWCSLDATSYAWGIGVVEDGNPSPTTYTSYCPDIINFGPPYDVDEYGYVPDYNMCYKDQYDNEYWFDINFAENYAYGVVMMAQNCDAPLWYLQGSFYITTSGIEFELSAANPLGDYDTMCVASYKLKGKKVGTNWQFMWYYQDDPYGSQQANLLPCSNQRTISDEVRGALRE